MKRRTLLVLALSSQALFACAAPTAVGYEPGTTPAARDKLQRETPAPEIAPMEDLTSTTVEAVFDLPADEVSEWFEKLPLDKALPGTPEVPGVERTEPLTNGRWGTVGQRRRVVLKDGSTALEEIVESELPKRVRYVVWNYTTDAAAYVEYGVGEFRFAPAGDKTKVEWTYAFASRGWPASWFLPGFVNGDYRAMMEKSIVAMKELAGAFDATPASSNVAP